MSKLLEIGDNVEIDTDNAYNGLKGVVVKKLPRLHYGVVLNGRTLTIPFRIDELTLLSVM